MSVASNHLRVLNLAFGKPVKTSKHQASKKGFRHQHNLSKGELNSLKNKKFHTAKEIILLKSLGIDVL